MAKSKYGTALYEVFRKAESNGRHAGKRDEPARVDASVPPPVREQPREPARAEEDPPGRPEDQAVPRGAAGRTFEVVDGRVRVALTPGAMAAGIFVMACLLTVAYGAGVRVGEGRGREAGFAEGREYTNSATLDEIQVARTQPPAQELFADLGDSPVQPADTAEAASPEPAADEPSWVRGYTYVVVQDFRAGDAEVMKVAQDYLAGLGIETAAVPLTGDYCGRLIATQGFNRSDDPVQAKLCDDFWARIRQAGQEFMTHPRNVAKYRLEGYLKTLSADMW